MKVKLTAPESLNTVFEVKGERRAINNGKLDGDGTIEREDIPSTLWGYGIVAEDVAATETPAAPASAKKTDK
jgi:hypothetical protein